ncbi:MAG: GerMN domain-containing protein [Microthrixaceae bacterium]
MVKASALVLIVMAPPGAHFKQVMSSLLVPPSGGEGQPRARFLRCIRLLGISGPENGLVEIDLSEDFEDVEGEARVLAVGQIVMSETLLPDVETLTFSIEGEPLSVFSPESGDVEVADACDYATTLTDPTAEDVDLTIQQALSLNDRRQELRELLSAAVGPHGVVMPWITP